MAQPGPLAGFPQAQAQNSFAQGPPAEGGGFPPNEEDSPLFHSDDFRIWCMKVIPCTKRFVHDWTVCPFAHAGEKAVRRDPRTHNYTGIACPDMKKQSSCIRGDKCPYAHNVFEYWLHPTRYRTQLCNDGPTCKRSICFFAHSLEELRVPAVKPYVSPEALARASLEAIQQNPHPLGQQLPNPAVTMRAASGQLPPQSGTPRGAAYSPHAGGARGAAPFGAGLGGFGAVGGGMHGQGGYGAPAGTGPYGAAGGGAYGMPPPQAGGGYGGLPPHQQQGGYGAAGMPQRMSAPARASADFGRRGGGLEGVKLSLTPSTPGWGADMMLPPGAAGNEGPYHQPSRNSMGAFPSSPAPAQGWAPDFGVGSLPSSAGGYVMGPASTGLASVPASCRPSYDAGASAFAAPAAQAAAAQRLSSNSLAGRGSHDSLHALHEGGAVRRSDGSDGPAAAGSPHSDGSASGASVPVATELDLAQSLATLKIALTQQHVAAASGSNHEIVISTLHQILKDAVAQHGGKMPNLVLPGAGGSPPPGAAAGVTPAALAASSALYSPSALAGLESAASCPPPRGAGSPGPAAAAAAQRAHSVAQQPWISTMGELKWDAPAGPGAAARPPPSPTSTTQPGQAGEGRRSGGTDE